MAFSNNEVNDQVGGGPALAQGRGLGANAEQEVTKGIALRSMQSDLSS
jgi:hypothetical protein